MISPIKLKNKTIVLIHKASEINLAPKSPNDFYINQSNYLMIFSKASQIFLTLYFLIDLNIINIIQCFIYC